MSETNNGGKRHYIADEELGGIEREYIEVDRKAEVGDYVVSNEQLDFTDRIYEVFHIAGEWIIGKYSRGHVSLSNYRTLSPTNIVRISGECYEMADRRAEVGDKILMTSDEDGGAIIGVNRINNSAINFLLSHGKCSVISPLSADESTGYLANERGDVERLTDMLVSLSQEVAQLKRKISELSDDTATNAKDIRTWADDYTQNKAEVADLTEMLTDDIVLLDDRTQPLTTEGVSNLSEELTEVVTEAIDEYLTRREAEAFLRRMGGR